MLSPILLMTYLLDGISEDFIQLNISKIKVLENKLLKENIICDFSKMSFIQLQFEYSNYISVTNDKIVVNHLKKFLSILKNRTRYIIEDETKDIVIKLWER